MRLGSSNGRRVGNQMDTAMIFAWANFVSAHHLNRRKYFFNRKRIPAICGVPQAELNDSGGLFGALRGPHQNKSRKNRSIVFRTISDTGTA